MNWSEIKQPTLIVDKAKVLRNVRRMASKADDNTLVLKPHFKTHQSRGIGRWIKEEGIEHITVSSLAMAKYFADDGWAHITVAFPVNSRETELINILTESTSLTILISDPGSLDLIKSRLSKDVRLLVEIDCGYHRTGMDSTNISAVRNLVEAISIDGFLLEGLYCHSGNTYKADSIEAIEKIHQETLRELMALKEGLFNMSDLTLSLGDTPSCSISTDFRGISSIRPGNFVFYDYMQYRLESCSLDDIAIALAAPVVFKNKERMEIVVYGGGVHLAKDSMEEEGRQIFGKLVKLEESGWTYLDSESTLISVSQEHGIAKVSKDDYHKLELGDLVGILPVHSCMTADLMGSYLTLEGESLDHMSGSKFGVLQA